MAIDRRLFLGALGAGALLAAVAGWTLAEQSAAISDSSLEIVTASGAHPITVEVATDDATRARGLMFRRSMPADHGMLFVYERPHRVAMWMKNTFIPLDMLFIDRDGEIVDVAERTVPESLATIRAPVPVIAVLELNGGTVDRLDIAEGDRVRHPALGTAAR